MPVRSVRLWPSPRLKEVSAEVSAEQIASDSFKDLVKDLAETLLHYRGFGISAIQVGEPVRLFVMHGGAKGVRTYVNPTIESTDGDLEEMDEGCLSLPGVFERVKRYPGVIVSAHDFESGERRSFDLIGTEAQCAQHEMEHLDGKLFSDDYGRVKKDIVRRKIQKALKFNPAYQEKK